MQCGRCGKNVPAGSTRCPACGAELHYDGNTTFFREAKADRLDFKSLFTGVGKKHPRGSAGKVFIGGTPDTTPDPAHMLEKWQRPWLFSRFFLAGVVFCILAYILYAGFSHPGGWLALTTIGSMVVPLTVLIFFWEVNIPRNIPIYTVVGMFMIGGLLSIIFTLIGGNLVDFSSAVWAPVTEEPAKMLAGAVFLYYLNSRYGLNGILIGASVGAGFACFENLFYVMWNGFYRALGETSDTIFAINYSVALFFLRNLGNLGGRHSFWAAAEVGALALAKGEEKLAAKHFANKRVLVCLFGSCVIHAFNNSGVLSATLLTMKVTASTGESIDFPILELGGIIATAASVALVFWLLKPCLKQILEVADERAGSVFTPQAAALELVCVAGPQEGRSIRYDGRPIHIGREAGSGGLELVLPEDTKGVSRRHCSIQPGSSGWTVRDLNSSYGTFLSGGRVPPGQKAALRDGEIIYLGSKKVAYRVTIRQGVPVPRSYEEGIV